MEGSYSEAVLTWLKLVNEEKTLTDALEHRRNIGGQLYGDLDGSEDSLEFLVWTNGYRLADKCVGASKVYFIPFKRREFYWENLRGQNITGCLDWAGGSPPESGDLLVLEKDFRIETKDE